MEFVDEEKGGVFGGVVDLVMVPMVMKEEAKGVGVGVVIVVVVEMEEMEEVVKARV